MAMMFRRSRLGAPLARWAALVLVLAVGACSAENGDRPSQEAGSSPPAATDAPGAVASEPPASDLPGGGPSAPAVTPGGVVVDRAWATADLVDVSTGATFRVTDLVAEGTVVFLEPMAIWCTNCRAQQADAMTALDELGRSKVVWIGLDIDPSETAEALAEYGPRWGFDHTYVLAGPDLSRALVDDFGPTVISPPSTPLIVVGIDGTVSLTDYGHKSVDDIIALAVAHGA